MNLFTVILILVAPLISFAKSDLPFWTEKSTYIEGDKIYAVGISEPNSDQAKARVQALERALVEIQNYLQLTDIMPLEVETQVIHEVEQVSKWRVYRLVYVSHNSAMELKQIRIDNQTKAIKIETARIKEQTKSLAPVLQEYENSIRDLDEIQKSADFARDEFTARRQAASAASKSIQEKIKERGMLACLVVKGMTPDEVQTLIGKPDQVNTWHTGEIVWVYGTSYLKIGKVVYEVKSDQGCK